MDNIINNIVYEQVKAEAVNCTAVFQHKLDPGVIEKMSGNDGGQEDPWEKLDSLIGMKEVKDQVREIEVSRQFPFVEDEDSPEVDPQKNPELWAKALEALASRNRRMAKRMA